MASLNELVREVVYSYAWKGLDLKMFRATYTEENAFSVMMFDYPVHQQDAAIVVIDADNTDRPLVDKLVEASIPREKIILAYVGEKIPVAEG